MKPYVESGGLRRKSGFTLLEVLVAMVVLSIGLLGLSGLQTSSLRNNHSAFLRSQATLVSNDIIDRMRANRDSATNGDYDIAYTATPTASTCSSGCSASDVANLDLGEWRSHVERLPGGESSIDVTSDIATVRVCWGDVRGNAVACNNPATDKLILVMRAQL
jgi:type IV pilus assembly protein PilV